MPKRTLTDAMADSFVLRASTAASEDNPQEAIRHLRVANAFDPLNKALQDTLQYFVADPYTPQYRTITTTGHTRPTQAVGAPTLGWHVAVWPRRTKDPQHIKPKVPGISVEQDRAYDAAYDAAVQEHNNRRRNLFVETTDPTGA